MITRTVLGLLITALLFCGGCRKKPIDVKEPNEAKTVKSENDELKSEIQKVEAKNADLQKRLEELTNNEIEKDISKSSEREINDKDNIKVSKPFFGICLGETINELSKRFRYEPSNVAKDEDDPTKSWIIQQNNPNFLVVSVGSVDNYIYQILVMFKDASRDNFDALKTQLKKTYGNEQNFGGGYTPGAESNDFLPIIDGIPILIRIEYRKGYGLEADRLIIFCGHRTLFDKVQDEIKRCKLAKVQGDL